MSLEHKTCIYIILIFFTTPLPCFRYAPYRNEITYETQISNLFPNYLKMWTTDGQTDGLMDQSFTLTWFLTTTFYEASVVTAKLGSRTPPAIPLATALVNPAEAEKIVAPLPLRLRFFTRAGGTDLAPFLGFCVTFNMQASIACVVSLVTSHLNMAIRRRELLLCMAERPQG